MLNTKTHVEHKYVPNYQFANTYNSNVSFISQIFHRRKSAIKEKKNATFIMYRDMDVTL
jgi:hypothetical protein